MIAEAAISVSMRIKTARPWSNVEKKPEKIHNHSQKKFQRKVRFYGQEYWKWHTMMNWFTNEL